jgi:hypothetical protein
MKSRKFIVGQPRSRCHFRVCVCDVCLAQLHIQGWCLPFLICGIQEPLRLLWIACAEATLACGIVLNVKVQMASASEHPICIFHGFCHEISIRETCEVALASSWRVVRSQCEFLPTSAKTHFLLTFLLASTINLPHPPFKTPWKPKVLKMAPEEGLGHLSPRLQSQYS